jgi:membrane complex biogenesis BtpA family protein
MAKVFMGVVHLRALPSAGGEPFDATLGAALEDARALRDGGVDAILVENFGDAPFRKGTERDRVSPDVAAGLCVAAREIRSEAGLPVGVNCLRNDAIAALGAAAVADARWVRVNVLAGAFATDQGIIEGEAARVAEYRRRLGCEIQLLADLLVKHAVPLAPQDPAAGARDLVERSGADGIIVTGARTGAAVAPSFLRTVRDAIGDFPLWVGSGVSADNAAGLWPLCDGAIVGSALKRDGRVTAPVDERRVAALRAALA